MPNRLQNTFILKEIMLYCFILMLMFLISSFYFILQQKKKNCNQKDFKKKSNFGVNPCHPEGPMWYLFTLQVMYL